MEKTHFKDTFLVKLVLFRHMWPLTPSYNLKPIMKNCFDCKVGGHKVIFKVVSASTFSLCIHIFFSISYHLLSGSFLVHKCYTRSLKDCPMKTMNTFLGQKISSFDVPSLVSLGFTLESPQNR